MAAQTPTVIKAGSPAVFTDAAVRLKIHRTMAERPKHRRIDELVQ
jgi:hypothetical protein